MTPIHIEGVTMRAISLWQPWATLIAIGAKRIETRSWKPPFANHDGVLELAIHAATKCTGELERVMASEPFAAALSEAGLDATYLKRLGPGDQSGTARMIPLGAIVAIAQVVWCRETEVMVTRITPQEKAFGNYAPGRYAWLLANVRRLRVPVPCKGRQGIFTLPAEVAAQVRKDADWPMGTSR